MNLKFRLGIALAVTVGLLTAAVGASAFHSDEQNYHPIERDEFERVWERTDRPVAELVEARTWIWGPGGFSTLLTEEYDDEEREVQYFDKSRMEMPITASTEDVDSPWFITQGLLATELMTGRLQLGDESFEQHLPSQRSAAGDPQDTTAPTYAAMGSLMERDARSGEEVIVEYANRVGVVVEDEARFAGYGVTDVEGDWQSVDGISHNIASVFWDFMTSEATVYENGQYVEGDLFLNAFYAVGYPLTDAFWADVTVRGDAQHVLIQCFERRCLTFTPGNPDGWEVESGNIGQHYYDWRYNEIGDPIPDVDLVLSPTEATNTVGTEFNLTATVMENGTAAEIANDTDVSITVARGADDDVDVNETITLDTGVATISYTGPETPAVDTITVNVEYGEETLTATATKTWVEAAPEFALALAQTDDVNVVDTSHEFTATLTENGDSLDIDDASDVTVSIARDGTTLDPLPADLNVEVAGNVATISYTGPENVAVDVINVSVDVNGTAVAGSPELTKTWVAGDAVSLTLNVLEEQLQEDWLGEFPMAYRSIEAQLVDEFGNIVEDEDVEVTFTRTSTTSTGGEGQFATINPDTQQGAQFAADTGVDGIATAIYGVNAENPALPFNVTVEAEIAGMVDGEEITFEIVGSSTAD